MDHVAGEFEWFADWADSVAPLYERLAHACASDERLLDIAAEASESQPPPNLLFGAVHALLLDGVDHRLAAFYPTCREEPLDPDESDPFPAFREFVLEHEREIRSTVASRRVQTNAVGRSAVLFPAFKHLATQTDAPLALVEIGSSAGLNLYWDRFQYEYEGAGTYGNPDSPVRVESAVRGSIEPPLGGKLPEIGHRVGIDVNTLDVTDPDDARWLRALVIPDQQWRFDRLDSAIEMVSNNPPELIEGDALDILPAVIAEMPPEYEVCVFSTLVLYQFDDEQVDALRDLLEEQSERRPVHWLSNDPSGDKTPPTYRYRAVGEGAQQVLAEYKAHGEWIRWLAGEESRTSGTER